MDTKDNAFKEASLKGVDVEDLKLATSKMKGMQRRTFQAEMVLKYCGGNARQGEAVFGWSRRTISVGLAEKRTGLECFGLQRCLAAESRGRKIILKQRKRCLPWHSHIRNRIRVFAPRCPTPD